MSIMTNEAEMALLRAECDKLGVVIREIKGITYTDTNDVNRLIASLDVFITELQEGVKNV